MQIRHGGSLTMSASVWRGGRWYAPARDYSIRARREPKKTFFARSMPTDTIALRLPFGSPFGTHPILYATSIFACA
jgi:hypothetical protein